MRCWTGVATIALALLAGSCGTLTSGSAPVHVVVVGTTDHHGWFAGHTESNVGYGGLPVLASYVEALRAANDGRVVLVDSGDMFQGTLESNLFEGEPVVRGYNLLGYAAAAVGNHEFDFGPVGPVAVAQKDSEDALGALKARAAEARFPFLAANITEASTGKAPDWVKAGIIVERGGARIGIIGLSTPDTPSVTQPRNVISLRFGDPAAAAIATARDLRAAGADAVIVIAHMGGRCTDLANAEDSSSCEPGDEIMNFARDLPRGTVDAIFAGHTHQRMRHIVNGTPVLQGGALSREFSTLDLWVDPAAHRVVKRELRQPTMICAVVYAGTESCDGRRAPQNAALTPRQFEGRTIAADESVRTALQPYLDKVATRRSEKLGITTASAFTTSYRAESPLGDLLADALRDAYHADVAFLNSGGLRAPLRAGDLVYGDMFEVSPFDNFPVVLRMTGAQIEEAVRASSEPGRGLLQVSGLRYEVAAPGRLARATDDKGRPLVASRLYKVATIDFLLAGGDGMRPVMQSVPPSRIEVRPNDGSLRDVLIASLRKRTMPLQPRTDGRVVLPAASRTAAASQQ